MYIFLIMIILAVFCNVANKSNERFVKRTNDSKNTSEDTICIQNEDKKKTVPFGYVNFSGKLVRQENLDRHFCPDIRDLKDNFSHTHITVVPEGYVNLNGKLVRHEDLELYQ